MREAITKFISAASGWICDGYFADIRYLLENSGEATRIISVSIDLNPLPPGNIDEFSVQFGQFSAGRTQIGPVDKKEVLELLADSASGRFKCQAVVAELAEDEESSAHSEGVEIDSWSHKLHLKISSKRLIALSANDLRRCNNELRSGSIPFDGVDDLCNWLVLPKISGDYVCPQIEIFVGPPVDLIIGDKNDELHDGELRLTLHAHSQLDTSLVRLGIRAVPGSAALSRRQVAGKIDWTIGENGRQVGRVSEQVPDALSVLSMLSFDGSTVRRHWFVDPKRSPNYRSLIVQHFDKDLRKLRNALFESDQSHGFEKAIATLAFILGFDPVLQIEQEAPDLIATAPSGRILVVECTLKIADIASKAGKLIDRRIGLENMLRNSRDSRQVFAILVTRQDANNPAVDIESLRSKGIIVLTRESLQNAVYRLDVPADADALLNELLRSPEPESIG